MMIGYNKSEETQKENKNKTKTRYFLKVTLTGNEPTENLSCDLLRLKNKNFSFGEFNNCVSSQYGIEPEYEVVEFFPKSKEIYPFACEYKTCEQALDAAIKHLNKEGFDATPFNLEDLVNIKELVNLKESVNLKELINKIYLNYFAIANYLLKKQPFF